MLTGLHPFDFSGQSTDAQMARRIIEHEAPPLRDSPVTSHLSDSALDLIERLMSWDDNTRLTAQQMLDVSFFCFIIVKENYLTDV